MTQQDKTICKILNEVPDGKRQKVGRLIDSLLKQNKGE